MTTNPQAPTMQGATSKPQLSFWQIWNMCFGFLGIQFGFALQNANVSRIFQTLGAHIDDIPILWVAAPVTGLIVQPIIGYLSDKTWNGFGRRRPFFLLGAVLSSLAILYMPNSPTLWIAAGMLWIMDASINISMEPFRAFVGDMLPEKQRPTGYAMQSFFIGIGAVVASALPWMMENWFMVSNTAAAGEIPDTVKFSFYAGAVVLFIAVMWTVFTTKEYSPEELAAFEAHKQQSVAQDKHAAPSSVSNPTNFGLMSIVWLVLGTCISAVVYSLHLDKQLYILGGGMITFGVLLAWMQRHQSREQADTGFSEIMTDLFSMPTTMRKLAVVQFFSWFALFSMWIYTTAGVTEYHYGTTDTASAAFNSGANWVGVLFAGYNGFAALAAVVIPVMIRFTSIQISHCINLFLGGIGLASFLIVSDPNLLLINMVGVGFAWASILSLPYALLSNSLPADKMGVFMGIFNFFIVIPQILAASILGFLLNLFFEGKPIYALIIGGCSMIIAGLYTLTVKEAE